ncbi:MAG TPA: ABC transporter ATP-binding protein [Syntrophobacteraceae bacterium]|nr:ABC transporter ATP-binding protein [Syntrophobacteraceae bacterium]
MNAAVVLRNLELAYGSRPILRDISFSVREKEFLIIIGPNGSGKTTLVKVISGAVGPQKGEVQVLGSPLKSYSGKALARCVAVVPQVAPVDIPFTVAEMVLMGRSPHLGWLEMERRKDLEIAERAMVFTSVEHLAGRRLDQLSAGERQRVLIARAICQQPRIIVLDEPTASLDPAHQVHIMDLLEQLRNDEGITVIMVSHDLNLAAMYADRLLLMKQGEVVSLGEPTGVLTFDTLEQTYGCVLLVDDNPLKKVPRVTLVPKKLLGAAGRDDEN